MRLPTRGAPYPTRLLTSAKIKLHPGEKFHGPHMQIHHFSEEDRHSDDFGSRNKEPPSFRKRCTVEEMCNLYRRTRLTHAYFRLIGRQGHRRISHCCMCSFVSRANGSIVNTALLAKWCAWCQRGSPGNFKIISILRPIPTTQAIFASILIFHAIRRLLTLPRRTAINSTAQPSRGKATALLYLIAVFPRLE